MANRPADGQRKLFPGTAEVIMKHTGAEIEDAARRFEQLAENLDPASVAAEDLSDMRAVECQRPRRFPRRVRAGASRTGRSGGDALRIGSAMRTRKSSSVSRAG